MKNNINLKYPHSKPERFRIVKLSDSEFRVDYLLKFLGINVGWDKKLKTYEVYGGVDDGYETFYMYLIFTTIDDAFEYIDLSTKPKRKKLKKKPVVVAAHFKEKIIYN
jgi:hypothetical protein